MRFIFFSLRDFKFDVGESVRMYGILNSLAKEGKHVVFISNAEKFHMFDPTIKHVSLNSPGFSKTIFQALLSIFPSRFVYWVYKQLFDSIEKALLEANANNEKVYFFDYLDNSLGFVLKAQKKIAKNINDIHGIATLEFESYMQNQKSIVRKVIGFLKLLGARRLDRKVFENSDGFIFGSKKMQEYYENIYRIDDKIKVVIPYLLGSDAASRVVDQNLKATLKKDLQITDDDFVILFVGTYKPTAGVDDLIKAFERLSNDFENVKLILVGAGPTKKLCQDIAGISSSRHQIYFKDNIPYKDLLTLQSLANVVVCPDKDNTYSRYVVHVKYLDALLSGRLVINGAFESVKEINPNDSLSLTFTPSSVEDLYAKLKHCKLNYLELMDKYKHTKGYVVDNLSYTSYIKILTN